MSHVMHANAPVDTSTNASPTRGSSRSAWSHIALSTLCDIGDRSASSVNVPGVTIRVMARFTSPVPAPFDLLRAMAVSLVWQAGPRSASFQAEKQKHGTRGILTST